MAQYEVKVETAMEYTYLVEADSADAAMREIEDGAYGRGNLIEDEEVDWRITSAKEVAYEDEDY